MIEHTDPKTSAIYSWKSDFLSSWRAGALIIIAVGTLAYLTSFEGAFVFDDLDYVGTPDVRQLLPPWDAMFGAKNVSRPLIGLSLAINYAISGFNPWSYHVLNLLAHLAATLALWGIVRRTLLTSRLSERFGAKSFVLSLAVALVWMVHPLQTQAVTYVIQRCESFMGMFYLVTLYCAIRSFDSQRKGLWYAAAVAACAGGMMSKQVMVTAPLMVLLYDAMFLSGSFREALRKRWLLYAGLASTGILLVATTLASPVNETAGFAVKSITPLRYFVSEFPVIVHYLRLSLWPDPLVLDYTWPKTTTLLQAAPYGVVLLVLGGATLWGLMRRHPAGFAGAWFFIILSVTSSFMPFSDLAFEQRMYVPLAGVVTLLVIAGYSLGSQGLRMLSITDEQRMRLGRIMAFATVALILAWLVLMTLRRNVDYQSEITIWSDTLSKRPENYRAHTNLGKRLADLGLIDDAMDHYREALRIKPSHVFALNNLGVLLIDLGKTEEGKVHLQEAVRANPNYPLAHYNLGRRFALDQESDEAVRELQIAIKLDPGDADSYYYLGYAHERLGRLQESIDDYKMALRLRPDWPGALTQLARLLASQRDPQLRNSAEAVKLAERAARITQMRDLLVLEILTTAYTEDGRLTEAARTAQMTAALASTTGDKELAAQMQERAAKLYLEGQTQPKPAASPVGAVK